MTYWLMCPCADGPMQPSLPLSSQENIVVFPVPGTKKIIVLSILFLEIHWLWLAFFRSPMY